MKHLSLRLLPLYGFVICITTLHCGSRTADSPSGAAETHAPAAEKTLTLTAEEIKPDTIAPGNAMAVIEGFYKGYMKAWLNSDEYTEDLRIKRHLTPALIEKLERMSTSMHSNGILRAQDTNEDALESLKARHLAGNWYMVEYDWRLNSDEGLVQIPLRVDPAGGRYLIDYITPEWSGLAYGDSILMNKLPSQSIDSSTPLRFLTTFYGAYVSEYCAMPEGLEARLEKLRERHLTTKALEQFKEAEDEQWIDSNRNWDLLIAAFDFDCLWIPSISYKEVDVNTFEMCYTPWPDKETVIRIGLKQEGDTYQIDSIAQQTGWFDH